MGRKITKIKGKKIDAQRTEFSDGIIASEARVSDSPLLAKGAEAFQYQVENKVEDPGMGKPVIIRQYEFRYPPTMQGRPTKEQILTPDYRKHLNNILWADDLELIEEPRVSYTEKGFRIFAPCQARKGRLIPADALRELRPLQEMLNGQT